MLPTFISIVIIIAAIVLWTISIKRRLVILEENISNAMSQIGVQLSSRFDTLIVLLELTKCYARNESEMLIKTIQSRRSAITENSTPEDVLRQEEIISKALSRIALVTELYPELLANQYYNKLMNALQTFDNMVHTSRLIYNDSVAKLNRTIRKFPVLMIAGILGFRKRGYLEDQTDMADMPSMT